MANRVGTKMSGRTTLVHKPTLSSRVGFALFTRFPAGQFLYARIRVLVRPLTVKRPLRRHYMAERRYEKTVDRVFIVTDRRNTFSRRCYVSAG